MQKKLLTMSLLVPAIVFAGSLDMSTLSCKGVKLDSATTLHDVQTHCLLREQGINKGRYMVKFRNDATGSDVVCYFGSDAPNAPLNGCK